MRRDADVVVVGGGITGAGTLRALSRSGIEAILLEQFEVGHTRGSSHGTSRIFRLAYPDPVYARLAREALGEWRELENECGERLIVHTGTLDLGDAAADTERALGGLGIPFETLSGDAASRRWPLVFEPGARPVFQPDGGFFRADRAHAALIASAQAAGGDLVERERVVRIDLHSEGVTVATPTVEIAARAVVVAAGAWARDLLASVGVVLPVSIARETVAYFSLTGVETLPPVIEYPSAASPLPEGQAYYALAAPGRGLKAGIHHAGLPADPDEDGIPDLDAVERTAAWVARRFHDVDPTPLAAETCLYTNTVDQSFVIEAHGRIVVASACSGHGFKFAPLHGSIAARLALEAGHAGAG